MILPGKLAIGFLQEDNPQKFYFRIRPVIVEGDQGYQPLEDAKQTFAEDGYIRIVPDKNEIGHFKARMRSIGRYCLIDLRKHPNENDKIRPNKNYAPETGDRNAFIVYSDVIFAMSPLMLAEVLDGENVTDPIGALFPTPGTRLVMLARAGRLEGPFEWREANEGMAALAPLEGSEPLSLDAAMVNVRAVSFEGVTTKYLMNLGMYGVREPKEEPKKPEEEAPKPEEAPVKPLAEPTKLQEAPAKPLAEPIKPQEAPVKLSEAPAAEEPAPEPKPEMKRPAPEVKAEAKPEARRPEPRLEPRPEPKPEPEAKPAPKPEVKPWLQKTVFASGRPVSARMNPREQSYLLQCGINPKRGRSLQDVVDEQWRQSRYDQLGHPVPGGATGQPVESPIEHAVRALGEAWQVPDARDILVCELAKNEALVKTMGLVCEASRSRADETPLDRMEAERLQLMGEIDELKKQRQTCRDELMEQLRHTYAKEIRSSEARVQALREERERLETDARRAGETAKAAAEALTGALEKIGDAPVGAAFERERERLYASLYRRAEPAPLPELRAPAAGELVSELRVRFENAGFALSNDEAVNLLACLTLGRIVVLSGPVGAGKSAFARLLSETLGLGTRFEQVVAQPEWTDFGRAVCAATPGGLPLVKEKGVERLLSIGDNAAPTMLLLEAANAAPVDRYAAQLMTLGEEGAPKCLQTGGEALALHDSLRVVMTVDDEALPLGQKLLDRAYFVRLRPLPADAPLPKRKETPDAEGAVSLDALERMFAAREELPGEVAHALATIRKKLAEFGVTASARALADAQTYCEAVTPLMRGSAMDTLDLALSERVLPAILASADLRALHAMGSVFANLPRCLYLLSQPLPLPPL